MPRRALPLLVSLALVAGALLSGCASTCDDACANTAKVCAAEIKASGKSFDVERCVESCEDNPDGCKNIEELRVCVAEAKTCSDTGSCPRCVK